MNNSNSILDVPLLNESEVGKDAYSNFLRYQEGPLTLNYSDDVERIIQSGLLLLQQEDSEIQVQILNEFVETIFFIANAIAPDRLKFSLTRALDNEFCINRRATDGGRVKIIIHPDGLIVFSYLPLNINPSMEKLTFHTLEDIDVEKMLYEFFAL